MKRALGIGLVTAVVAGFSGVLMLGWAYEGPRRFFRRVKLYKALRGCAGLTCTGGGNSLIARTPGESGDAGSASVKSKLCTTR